MIVADDPFEAHRDASKAGGFRATPFYARGVECESCGRPSCREDACCRCGGKLVEVWRESVGGPVCAEPPRGRDGYPVAPDGRSSARVLSFIGTGPGRTTCTVCGATGCLRAVRHPATCCRCEKPENDDA